MVTNLKEKLNTAQLKELQLISAMIAKGEPTDTLNIVWERFIKNSKNEIEASKNGEIKLDILELIMYVFKEAINDTSADLQYYMDRLKFHNELSEQMDEYMKKINDAYQDYIASQEEHLSKIKGEGQLAYIDWQKALQKQQQVLQAMPDVSEKLHDSAVAVIKKNG